MLLILMRVQNIILGKEKVMTNALPSWVLSVWEHFQVMNGLLSSVLYEGDGISPYEKWFGTRSDEEVISHI